MNKLIYNEMLKLVKSKRLLVVTIIIGIMIMMFTYAQHREMENVKKELAIQTGASPCSNQLSICKTESVQAGFPKNSAPS